MPPGCWDEVLAGLKTVEEARQAIFGDVSNPLLVSARSGAPVTTLWSNVTIRFPLDLHARNDGHRFKRGLQ